MKRKRIIFTIVIALTVLGLMATAIWAKSGMRTLDTSTKSGGGNPNNAYPGFGNVDWTNFRSHKFDCSNGGQDADLSGLTVGAPRGATVKVRFSATVVGVATNHKCDNVVSGQFEPATASATALTANCDGTGTCSFSGTEHLIWYDEDENPIPQVPNDKHWIGEAYPQDGYPITVKVDIISGGRTTTYDVTDSCTISDPYPAFQDVESVLLTCSCGDPGNNCVQYGE